MSGDGGGSDETVPWRRLHDEALTRFRNEQTPEPEVSARRIVEELSGHEGADFAFGLDEMVTNRGMAAFDKLVSRRLAGEPLQYVLGHWGFRELDLLVDPRVLIPRPESEVVAGLAISEVSRLAGVASPLMVVDLGAGSGALGLSVAAETSDVEVWLTDLSEDAIAVARANTAGLGTAGSKIRIAVGSWFDAVPDVLKGTLGVVVSNPPYVADHEELPSQVRDWEPQSALFAGPSGTEHLEALVHQSRSWLRSDGALVLEMAPWQTDRVAELASQRFGEVSIESDLAGLPRAVVSRHPQR